MTSGAFLYWAAAKESNWRGQQTLVPDLKIGSTETDKQVYSASWKVNCVNSSSVKVLRFELDIEAWYIELMMSKCRK
jgi:hypothetical protein